MKSPLLRSLRIRNFKAIRDSGFLKLTPLTVLIGNNGSGKSSVIEALETLRTFVLQDLDAAMQLWRGIEHIRHKAGRVQTRRDKKSGLERSSKPIEFKLSGHTGEKPFSALTTLNERNQGNELFIERESVRVGDIHGERGTSWFWKKGGEQEQLAIPLQDDKSFLGVLKEYIQAWQFLTLSPQAMGSPVPQTRTRGRIQLVKDGANIAEYLLDIRNRDLAAFEGIVETLKHILPYAHDLQPTSTSELERTVYLQLSEGDFKVPGWLLSTGTLRLLALLAVLRHPAPPSLVLIEEIENGLDPRAIHLLVSEIQNAVESGHTQVILTTHSPYLLDLLPLSSIVLVDRVDGEPRFTRPADTKEVQKWAESFSPGQLYTMSRLVQGKKQ